MLQLPADDDGDVDLPVSVMKRPASKAKAVHNNRKAKNNESKSRTNSGGGSASKASRDTSLQLPADDETWDNFLLTPEGMDLRWHVQNWPGQSGS